MNLTGGQVMWLEPLEMVDPAGKRVRVRSLKEAGVVVQRLWSIIPPTERANAYRMMTVEGAGASPGISREAVKNALIAADLREV